MFFLTVFLCVGLFFPQSALAADAIESKLRTMNLEEVDESARGFEQRLQERERKNSRILRRFHISRNLGSAYFTELEVFMRREKCDAYFDYLCKLLTTDRLSARQIIQDEFTMIPWFKDILAKSQAGTLEKSLEEYVPLLLRMDDAPRHAIRRIFFAVLSRATKKTPKFNRDALLSSLHHEDMALTRKLLSNGVDPREPSMREYYGDIFSLCKTKNQAKLLIDFGVNLPNELAPHHEDKWNAKESASKEPLASDSLMPYENSGYQRKPARIKRSVETYKPY